jgi:hypothetical protein
MIQKDGMIMSLIDSSFSLSLQFRKKGEPWKEGAEQLSASYNLA